MLFEVLLIFDLTLISFCSCYPERQTEKVNTSTLILTHVIFRHGYRTPDIAELYPKDPYLNYNYFPFGRGQLTNRGKRREYSIGVALRNRYDEYLGAYYYPGIMEAISSDMDRTKISLELVLAGLFPPMDIQKWSDLEWQPAPFNYTRTQLLWGNFCPNFKKMQNDVFNLPELRNEMSQYSSYVNYISENAGYSPKTLNDFYYLYFGLRTEAEWGLELPLWTRRVYPDFLRSMALRYYHVMNYSTKMTRLLSGTLLRKILLDTKAKILNRSKKKIHLYSAHEANIANLLIPLGIFDPPHIPPYGSYIIFEVHRIGNVYGIKIYYQNYENNDPQLQKLPTCNEFCPLNKFLNIVKKYLPTDDTICG